MSRTRRRRRTGRSAGAARCITTTVKGRTRRLCFSKKGRIVSNRPVK